MCSGASSPWITPTRKIHKKHNERLLGEARQQLKTAQAQAAQIHTLTTDIRTLKLSKSRANGLAEQIQEQLTMLHKQRETPI